MAIKTKEDLGSWKAYWHQFPAGKAANLNGNSAPVPVRGGSGDPVPVQPVPVRPHLDCPSVALYTYTRPAPGKHARNNKVGRLCDCGIAFID